MKQQIVAFDIEYVTPETDLQYDFSSITNTFWELRARGGLFNPRKLVGLLIPKVVENMLDAKAEVDARLRQAINDFTGQFVSRMTTPISDKNAKGKIADAAARTTKVRENIEKETPFLRSKLEEYIEDARTREMLVAAVMESVTQAYEDWFDTVYTPSLHTNGTSGSRSSKGKGREDDVWDPDVFSEWCGGVFKVGTLGLGIMDADNEQGGMDDEEDDGGADSVGGVSGRSGTERTGIGSSGIRIKM